MEDESMFNNNLWANKKNQPLRYRVAFATVILLALALSQIAAAATPAKQKTFASPEEAVKAAVTAAKNNDDKELLAIFGAQAKDLLFSGDAVADKQRHEQFLAAYNEKNDIVSDGESRILTVGKDAWPFPIPLVKKGESWVFDTDKGRDEILNRRIGTNELNAIQVVLAYVDAQREYAVKDRDGDKILEYARRFRSQPGKKDGLYWEAKPGEEQSPLGPFFAQAQAAGYTAQGSGGGQSAAPYYGYYYKILESQGKDAPGGAYSYVVNGNMMGGFALVAYPAEYGNSGVMTFIVNHDGKVFQKDLGANTRAVAQAMKDYNPDATWTEVKP
jgi:DUF2950 family protein